MYGPHLSVLYARLAAHPSLTSLVHYFIDATDGGSYPPSAKLQPGGPGYELTYATSGILPYFLSLGPLQSVASPHDTLNVAFEAIERHEATLLTPLVEFLLSKKKAGVRIVGLESVTSNRAPTVSFVVVGTDGRTKRLKSKDIVAHVDAAGNVSLFYFYSKLSRQF
jgi:hypothetical protein